MAQVLDRYALCCNVLAILVTDQERGTPDVSHPFTDLAAADPRHGGKAMGLRDLVADGFAVPPGIALSAQDVTTLLSGDPGGLKALAGWLVGVAAPVAIRSSAAAEDGAATSYAGMYETRLGIAPVLDPVLAALEEVSESGKSERAMAYSGQRTDRISVVVQKMVDARLSGVTFTTATDIDGGECLYAEYVVGQGEQLVSGRVTPARLVIPLDAGTGALRVDSVRLSGGAFGTDELAEFSSAFERLGRVAPGAWDVEWAFDDVGKLWLLQRRPVTRPVIVPGSQGPGNTAVPAAPGQASGPAFLVGDDWDTRALKEGDVLVSEITEVDFVPAMRRAVAIVTEQGGMLSHAAIVARELGKPCVIGARGALELLSAGEETFVDGSAGVVRQGQVLIGAAQSGDIDWRALALFDRGLEFQSVNESFYVEATFSGLIGYSSDEVSPQRLAAVQQDLRRTFGSNVTVVSDQKLLWYREWRRFDRLSSVALVSTQAKVAIARWDHEALTVAIDLIKSLAGDSVKEAYESASEELCHREFGAALHALCGVLVEGIGEWSAYRDSALWRHQHGVSFSELLRLPVKVAREEHPEIAGILACASVLARLRNEAYPFFTASGAFNLSYFENRDSLVRNACIDQGVEYCGESKALDSLYTRPFFRAFDAESLSRVLSLLGR